MNSERYNSNNVLEIGRETFAQNPVREPSIPNSITAITELDPKIILLFISNNHRTNT